MRIRKTDSRYRLARRILQFLPSYVRKRWKGWLEPSFRDKTISIRENQKALEQFQLKQITILLWGVLLFLSLVLILGLSSLFTKEFTFLRNPFGRGEKEVRLKLEAEGKKKEIFFTLEEQMLTDKEREQIFRDFFRKLKIEMKGCNKSLNDVTQPLEFMEKLDGYPFQISYEPEDLLLIDWNGDLGQKGLEIREEVSTAILVEASYKEYSRQERIPLRILPQKKTSPNLFERFHNALVNRESSSRKSRDFSVDSSWKEIRVKEASRESLWKLPFLLLGVIFLLLLRNHSLIGEKKRLRHKQNMEDFPLIVHLLTLYMGAGLSFSNAVERICKDYEKSADARKGRYAFEQMRMMNHCLHMGLRPREVCLEWGNHFPEKVYGRLAMLLTQSFSKGAREIRSMMEKEQQDAFQVQIDYVRKEGEEASTRLLFPMILLLFITMVLVMFPAFMQFYGI